MGSRTCWGCAVYGRPGAFQNFDKVWTDRGRRPRAVQVTSRRTWTLVNRGIRAHRRVACGARGRRAPGVQRQRLEFLGVQLPRLVGKQHGNAVANRVGEATGDRHSSAPSSDATSGVLLTGQTRMASSSRSITSSPRACALPARSCRCAPRDAYGVHTQGVDSRRGAMVPDRRTTGSPQPHEQGPRRWRLPPDATVCTVGPSCATRTRCARCSRPAWTSRV